MSSKCKRILKLSNKFLLEFHNGSVDSKALVLYVGSLYETMKDMVVPNMEEEVEEQVS